MGAGARFQPSRRGLGRFDHRRGGRASPSGRARPRRLPQPDPQRDRVAPLRRRARRLRGHASPFGRSQQPSARQDARREGSERRLGKGLKKALERLRELAESGAPAGADRSRGWRSAAAIDSRPHEDPSRLHRRLRGRSCPRHPARRLRRRGGRHARGCRGRAAHARRADLQRRDHAIPQPEHRRGRGVPRRRARGAPGHDLPRRLHHRSRTRPTRSIASAHELLDRRRKPSRLRAVRASRRQFTPRRRRAPSRPTARYPRPTRSPRPARLRARSFSSSSTTTSPRSARSSSRSSSVDGGEGLIELDI